MQIHELTQLPVSEGLMDNLKASFITDPRYASLDAQEKIKAVRQDQAVLDSAKKVMKAWNGYVFQLRNTVQDPAKFDDRSDGKYEDALRAFVQKNLFTGLPYARLTNLAEIEAIIDDLIKPLPPGTTLNSQGNLWTKLAQTAAVSQIVAQATPVGVAPVQKSANPTTKQVAIQPKVGDDPSVLMPQVVAALGQAGVPKGSIAAMGKVVSSFDPMQTMTLASTGNVGVDAMLLAMGFNVQ